jgi:hypothetical protein
MTNLTRITGIMPMSVHLGSGSIQGDRARSPQFATSAAVEAA